MAPPRRSVGPLRTVEELPGSSNPPFVIHPEWLAEMPWLAQGTTARAPGGAGWDMGLFGATPPGETAARWSALREAAGCARAVHDRQVHGASIRAHDAGEPGMAVGEGNDGHVTSRPGVLLTVSVADCVPAFLVDRERRAVALLHAGWRGAAAGILPVGIAALAAAGSDPAELLVHLGPAICGDCYEVGGEVFSALGDSPPAAPAPIDLRKVLAEQAAAQGVPAERITVSAHCTRCGGRRGARLFHSFRAGDPERQIAFMGVRG